MTAGHGAPGRLALTSLALVAVNLLPLVGVLYFGWSVYQVLLLFWAENLVIGVFTVARFWALLRHAGEMWMLVLIPFFCVHFGTFTIVHGVFVVGFFRPEDPAAAVGMALWIPVLALFVSHGLSHWMNFLGDHEYRRTSWQEIMTAPYRRVVALHVTIIVGGFLVTWLGEPVIALALLVLLKIGIDVTVHFNSHRDKRQSRHDDPSDTHGRQTEVFRGWD